MQRNIKALLRGRLNKAGGTKIESWAHSLQNSELSEKIESRDGYFSDNNLFVLWRSVLHRGPHPVLSRGNITVVCDSAARIAWVAL